MTQEEFARANDIVEGTESTEDRVYLMQYSARCIMNTLVDNGYSVDDALSYLTYSP